jgi:pimeloyl-ACP methyl ester carboxylesterase
VHAYVGQFHKQVTVFHGTDDGVVPYEQSRRLAAIFPFVELVTIEKGKHNDLFNFPFYRQKMKALLR